MAEPNWLTSFEGTERLNILEILKFSKSHDFILSVGKLRE